MSRSKYDSLSHLPQGRCGLKLCVLIVSSSHMCHLPQGRCGLKSIFANNICRREESPSARKVWIEIESLLMQAKYVAVTFCKEGVD